MYFRADDTVKMSFPIFTSNAKERGKKETF